MDFKERGSRIHVKMVILIAAFMAVLCLVCVLLRIRMDALLIRSMNMQVQQQSLVLASALDSKIEAHLASLKNLAKQIENDWMNIDAILAPVNRIEKNAQYGIIDLYGKCTWGDSSMVIKPKDFQGVVESFRGIPFVSYNEEKGVLLTVPIFSNGNVKGVLYKLYSVFSDELLIDFSKIDRQRFVSIRDGKGHLLMGEATDDGFDDAFKVLRKKLQTSNVAIIRKKRSNGIYYYFMHELSAQNLFVSGVVPEKSLGLNAEKVPSLVFKVVGCLILFFAMSMGIVFLIFRQNYERNRRRLLEETPKKTSEVDYSVLRVIGQELRIPIGNILGVNTILLKENKDPTIKEYARSIQSVGMSLLSLVNNVVDLSKMEAGDMELVPVQYNLFSVLSESYDMLKLRANDKSLHSEIEVDQTIPTELFGDEIRVRQIINNLLLNAVKYTASGSVMLKVDYERIASEPHGSNRINLIISVQDTGIGIRDEELNNLFIAFRRSETVGTLSDAGTGLGLSLTNSLVNLMGGKITVDSAYGKGSTFTVTIPQVVVKNESMGDFERRYRDYVIATEIQNRRFSAPGAMVLAVDDVPMNLRVMAGLLKETDVKLEVANNGMEAMEKIKRNHYDVIFMDKDMPIMDGAETLSIIRSLADHPNTETPIVLMTSNSIPDAREICVSEGFSDFLVKPVREESLIMMLHKYLPSEKVKFFSDTDDVNDAQNTYYSSLNIAVPLVASNVEKDSIQEMSDAKVAEETMKHMGRSLPEDLENLAETGLADVKLGLDCCDGDEGLYRQKLREYSVSAMDLSLEQYYRIEDYENYRMLVHLLKGKSLALGAIEIASLAKLMENACNSGDYEYLRASHARLIREYRNFVKVLKELI